LLLVPFDTIVRDAPHAGERLIHRIVAIGIHDRKVLGDGDQRQS